MVTKYSLDEAQAAVLRAIQAIALDFDPVISEAEAAGLASEVNAFTDTFDLDEWVFASPLLKKRFCRFPLCFRAPRPPSQAEDGLRKGGNQPAYCADGVDESGRPHNDPKYADRRRKALRKQRADRDGRATSEEPEEPGDRPVSQARSTLAKQVTEVVRRFDELSGQVRDLTEVAERAGNEDLRYGEIQAVQLKAQEEVAHQTRLRLAAEASKRTAEQDANRARSELEEASDIIAQLTDEAAGDRAARAQAEQAAETTRLDAQRQIAAAQDRFDRELEEHSAARAAALGSAAQREREADAKVAAAVQAVASANDAQARAHAEADRLRQDNAELHRQNAALRDAAIERERQVEANLAHLTAEHQRQQSVLHETVERLHRDAIQTNEAHQQAMNELRTKYEQDLDRKLTDAASTAARVHAAELGALSAQLETLRARLGEQS